MIRLKLLPPFPVRLLYDSVVGLRARTTLLQIPQSYTTFNRPEPIDETDDYRVSCGSHMESSMKLRFPSY